MASGAPDPAEQLRTVAARIGLCVSSYGMHLLKEHDGIEQRRLHLGRASFRHGQALRIATTAIDVRHACRRQAHLSRECRRRLRSNARFGGLPAEAAQEPVRVMFIYCGRATAALFIDPLVIHMGYIAKAMRLKRSMKIARCGLALATMTITRTDSKGRFHLPLPDGGVLPIDRELPFF